VNLSAVLPACAFFLTICLQGAGFAETTGIEWYLPLPEYLNEEQSEKGIQAFSLALTRDSKLIHSSSAGTFENKPVNLETVFPAPALTPSLTTLLAARLADKKLLDWDSSATSIYSRFSVGGKDTNVTIRHLLDMAAGIPGYIDNVLAGPGTKPEDTFAIIRQTPSTAPPGTHFEPSDTSTATAGYLLARSTRTKGKNLAESYALALQMEIFDPLGMKNSHIDTANTLAPANGLHTCVHDLAKWIAAEAGTATVQDAPFLSPLTRLSRIQPVDLKGGRDYAMGWHIRYYENTRILARAGSHARHTILAGYLPEYHIGFALWMVGSPKQTRSIVEELPLAICELLRPGLSPE